MPKVVMVSESDIKRIVSEAVRRELSRRRGALLEGVGCSDCIGISDFREAVGWTARNMPLDESSLRLADGTSVAFNRGMRINGKDGYISCYRYDITKGIVFFPIVFAVGGRRFTAHSEEEIADFTRNMTLDEPFEVKKEIMEGSDYKEIRMHETAHKDRLPFNELYDWHTDRFYGYEYIEI